MASLPQSYLDHSDLRASFSSNEGKLAAQMDDVYARLAARARSAQDRLCQPGHQSCSRILIALAGPPGSGKSTVAAQVVERLNQDSKKSNSAVALPMDGFHLTRAALSRMSNSDEAFAKRGVHWTFDAEGVVRLISALHTTRDDRSIIHLAPSFDHERKDPVEQSLKIGPEVEIIIIEGNWLLFDEPPWSTISEIMDDTWFVDVDPEVAKARIAKRHIECGIETSWEEAIHRTTSNDMVNGDLVRAKLIKPAVYVHSRG